MTSMYVTETNCSLQTKHLGKLLFERQIIIIGSTCCFEGVYDLVCGVPWQAARGL
jgi:hypothetical protein